MSERRITITIKLGRLLRAGAAFVGLVGATVIVLQCVWWFQDGFWSPKSLLDLWFWLGNTYTPMRGGGSARIILWLLDLPLGAVLLSVALIGFWLADRLTRSNATS